ncbi:MAG: ankyrin repeat domain-containing protein [Steroidobacteraceae bacterium]
MRGYPGATAPHPKSTATALDLVNRLIAMGVDTNHELTRMRPNGNGRGRFEDYMMRGGTGPLMIATLSYDDTAIKILLAHGADVDAPNVFQITPLMAAAGMSGSGRGGGGGGGGGPRDGDVQGTGDHDARHPVGRRRGYQRPHPQQSYPHRKAHRVRPGSRPRGSNGAVRRGRVGVDKVVKHMIEHGADPAVRDASGKTALDYARTPPAGGPRRTTAQWDLGGQPRSDYCTARTAGGEVWGRSGHHCGQVTGGKTADLADPPGVARGGLRGHGGRGAVVVRHRAGGFHCAAGDARPRRVRGALRIVSRTPI